MTRSLTVHWFSAVPIFFAACFLAACAAPLGPGYVVEKQEIQVSFAPQPAPRIKVVAEYRLKNTGDRALASLDVRLPGPRFHSTEVAVSWDGLPLRQSISAANPRDAELPFPQSWLVGASHTLQFSYDIPSTGPSEGLVGFSPDAFYLSAESWTPELPQARGVFGFGGVPPKKWDLLVHVPQGFLVHASGGKERHSGEKTETQFRFAQTAADSTPFVIAGRYRETQRDLPQNQRIHIWSRGGLNSAQLQLAGDSLSGTVSAYDALLGARDKSKTPFWFVECSADAACFSRGASGYSKLLNGENVADAAQMISNDTVVVDPRVPEAKLEAAVAPALAQSWLGYGRNPGFYEQQPPMSALPAFIAALAREISSGPKIREEVVRRALAEIPVQSTPESDHQPVVSRAKSLLLFYALRDRVGPDAFQKALQHMLAARRGRGFDLADLISALEQESRQPVGPFVRQWIKRPGIPRDFRARLSPPSTSQISLAQEATQ